MNRRCKPATIFLPVEIALRSAHDQTILVMDQALIDTFRPGFARQHLGQTVEVLESAECRYWDTAGLFQETDR